ncbi:tryptophan synthase subunit alpha [Agrococcus terreus]|uniref:Tryptophan synthase alpha chain n=1 Tax=Agrococcus terreus TaxID=574649 RepID=A0ABQ2KHJ8_9MICO|nr:tryptophan synthase subunit alpha [Agrococcus terreus]GGN83707.1 tryptophan synthase alpha chain [Agrococcus terreus]
MSRTEDAIRASGGRALIGYLPVGYPDLATSVDAAVAMAEAGATAIELGVPYSDPGMDGPVIQAATQATLERGFRLEELFEGVAAIAARTDAPVLVMTYWNPVLRFGVERFAERLAAAGGAGLITPDLTPENAGEWLAAADRHDLDRVFLAAPSSSDARIDAAIAASRGFVYTVSTMGTTGARSDVDQAARALSDRIAAHAAAQGTTAMRCVGLGISTGEQVRDVLEYADGAIVGSALVRALGDGGVPAVRELTASLAAGAARVDASQADEAQPDAPAAATIDGGAAPAAAAADQKGANA